MNANLTKTQQALVDSIVIGAWFTDTALRTTGGVCVMSPDGSYVKTTTSKAQALIDKGVFVESSREITLRDRTVTQKIWVRNV